MFPVVGKIAIIVSGSNSFQLASELTHYLGCGVFTWHSGFFWQGLEPPEQNNKCCRLSKHFFLICLFSAKTQQKHQNFPRKKKKNIFFFPEAFFFHQIFIYIFFNFCECVPCFFLFAVKWKQDLLLSSLQKKPNGCWNPVQMTIFFFILCFKIGICGTFAKMEILERRNPSQPTHLLLLHDDTSDDTQKARSCRLLVLQFSASTHTRFHLSRRPTARDI